MKKMETIMAELGFREDAPTAVKEAFIKHLIQATMGVTVETPSEKANRKKVQKAIQNVEQLSLFKDIKDVG